MKWKRCKNCGDIVPFLKDGLCGDCEFRNGNRYARITRPLWSLEVAVKNRSQEVCAPPAKRKARWRIKIRQFRVWIAKKILQLKKSK